MAYKPEDFPEGSAVRKQIEAALAGTAKTDPPISADKVKAGRKAKTNDPGAAFAVQLRMARITGWAPEHKFHPGRKYRFDFAWPAVRLAVEINGGTFREGGGAHTGAGFRRDCEKGFAAAELGWQIIWCMPEHVEDGQLLRAVEFALGHRRKLFHVEQEAK